MGTLLSLYTWSHTVLIRTGLLGAPDTNSTDNSQPWKKKSCCGISTRIHPHLPGLMLNQYTTWLAAQKARTLSRGHHRGLCVIHAVWRMAIMPIFSTLFAIRVDKRHISCTLIRHLSQPKCKLYVHAMTTESIFNHLYSISFQLPVYIYSILTYIPWAHTQVCICHQRVAYDQMWVIVFAVALVWAVRKICCIWRKIWLETKVCVIQS